MKRINLPNIKLIICRKKEMKDSHHDLGKDPTVYFRCLKSFKGETATLKN